jgi:hypothetical protein
MARADDDEAAAESREGLAIVGFVMVSQRVSVRVADRLSAR